MTLSELLVLLENIKAKGIPDSTPITIAIGDENDDAVELIEIDDVKGLTNAKYEIASEKMAVIKTLGTIIVLSTQSSPNYENTTAATFYNTKEIEL